MNNQNRILTCLVIVALSPSWQGCVAPCSQPCGEVVAKRDEIPRDLTVLGGDVSPLRQAFNSSSDRWRAVALVSPTCSECVLGAEAVEQEIAGRYGADQVPVLVIWIPMLPSDNEQAARAAATIFKPEQVIHFYDAHRTVGLLYTRGTFAGFIERARKSLPEGHYLADAFDHRQESEQPQWDLYMLYAPGVQWDQSPPVPTHWIRHCGRNDGQKSTYWVDSPDRPPHEGDLFEAVRLMADEAIGTARVGEGTSRMTIGLPDSANRRSTADMGHR